MQRGLKPPTSALDLGIIKQPLFVFGGPYSNFEATQAVLEIAHNRGFSSEQIICTGDIVAYCANPVECVSAIRTADIHVVMGNCEESLGLDLADCGCGFEEDSACDIASKQWFDYASKRLADDDRVWMRNLPRQITLTMNGRRVSFIHGSATDISGWVFSSTPIDEKISHMEILEADVVIGGHCGLPFITQVPGNRVWANAGVVGMPANDGTARGWFATIWPENDSIGLKIEALDYNSALSVQAMERAGLVSPYTKSLNSGIWPNMDVLPQTERDLCGKEISSELITKLITKLIAG